MSTNSSGPISPDHVPALGDPGDETARRYRFQWTWAAISCCMLLDDTQDAIEVFCEHHEDILIKHRDGTFTGQQVKTRESDQPIWKANDQQVRSACARFVSLDGKYPGHFREFHFLTNHPLYVASNAQSLPYNLSQITAVNALGELPAGVNKWLRALAREAAFSDGVAFQALKRAKASDGLPKLQDSVMRLVDALTGCWPIAAECSHSLLRCSAQRLIDECARASALDHLQLVPAYIAPFRDTEASISACIMGKRMTVERVGAVLQEGLNSTAVLAGVPGRNVEPGTGSTELLFKKLDAGGFSAVSLNSAEDLRDKADYLGIAWTKRFGRAKGLDRYEHVRSLALSDAARSFEATRTSGQQFGPAMREDLRRRFKERRTNGEQLFDCTDEHLEGIAYSLTSQCRIQWSSDRPWEVE